MIKERGGRGRARAVLINFFPFLTYIYIYTIFLLLLSTVSQPPFSKGIGGRGGGSNKFDFSRTVAFDHRNSRITRTPFNENLYYLCAHVGIDRIDRKRIKFKLFAPCPATNNTTRERFFDKVH